MPRISIKVSDELVSRIDRAANSLGLTRSGFCGFLLGQGVLGFEKGYASLDKFVDNISDDLKEQFQLSDFMPKADKEL